MVDDGCQAALHSAAESNNLEALRLLLQYGVDVGAKDAVGLTAEDVASEDAFEVCTSLAYRKTKTF